jgi:nicotinamide-nucleotide amidase
MPFPTPRARILAIGDELLLGKTVDTNSTHIAAWLHSNGLRLDRVLVVGDRQADIEDAMRVCARACDLLIITGGLGPTDDDRTRHALAQVMRVPLVERAAAWKEIRRYYERIRPGFQVPESNRRQALMPLGSTALANDRGTAPGMLGRIGRCWAASLPGVPHEMTAMLERLRPRLKRLIRGLRVPAVAEIFCAGLGESTAQELVGHLMTESDPQVGITASERAHLTLRVVGEPRQVRERARELRRRLRQYLLPEPGVPASLVATLAKRRQTITVAESATAGHVVAQLGAVPGVSRVLHATCIAYHEHAKRDLLGVPRALVARHGVVSSEVVAAMAEGARKRASADIAIATTGVAGPSGGTTAIPVGTIWLAVSTAKRTVTRLSSLKGSRERIQARGAAQALLLAWDTVKQHCPGPMRF